MKNSKSRSLLLVLWLLTLGSLLGADSLHAQTFLDLYDFNCSTGGGCQPWDMGQLTQGADGNLYGTALSGGASGFGTVFKVTPDGSSRTDLWSFDGATNGQAPVAGLTLASDGNFYGTTIVQGAFAGGTVFRITPTASFTVLHSFAAAEGVVKVPPIQAKDGNLYGISGPGSTFSCNSDAPYRITLPAGTFKQLTTTPPGCTFDAPLFLASDGNLYGTTYNGGTFGNGTVFRMSTTGVFKIIHDFNGTDGDSPAGLTQGSDGLLYGTTSYGGANGAGEVYKMTLSGTLTVLHSFDACGVLCSNNDGANPTAALMAAPSGLFYGVNAAGGAAGHGTLFEITSSGSFSKLFDFGFTGPVPGSSPFSALVAHTNGVFYGVTPDGPTDGNFYSLTVPNLTQLLRVAGPIFLFPGAPVTILGNSLNAAINVSFGAVPAQFQFGSDTYLTADVPTTAADGPIIVTLATGLQIQTQMAVHILPMITNLDPSSGPVGTQVGIVGGGFNRATKVTFGGVKATNFTAVTPALIQAIVPARAKTGRVTVTTPNGTATSKQTFTVN